MHINVRVEFLPNKTDVPKPEKNTPGNPIVPMSFKHPLSVGHIVEGPNKSLPIVNRVVMIYHSAHGDTLVKVVPV